MLSWQFFVFKLFFSTSITLITLALQGSTDTKILLPTIGLGAFTRGSLTKREFGCEGKLDRESFSDQTETNIDKGDRKLCRRKGPLLCWQVEKRKKENELLLSNKLGPIVSQNGAVERTKCGPLIRPLSNEFFWRECWFGSRSSDNFTYLQCEGF